MNNINYDIIFIIIDNILKDDINW